MRDLIQRQYERETKQVEDGIKRYNEQMSKQGMGESKPGLGLVFVAMQAMIPWIQEKVRLLELPYEEAKAANSLPSQVPLAVQWLTEMQPEAVAYLTAKIAVTNSYNEANCTRTAMKIANLIEENYRYEQLEQAQPALANSMGQRARRWPSARIRRNIMRKAADVAGIKRMGWTETEKLKLGIKLLEVYETTTGFATLKAVSDPVRGKKQQQKIIVMTEAARERLNMRREQVEADDPINKPMLCPPKPWINPTTGGYLTDRLKQPILRGATFRKVTEGLIDELFSSDMEGVYAAVNAIQATPWRVNKGVYQVLREAWLADIDMGVLPPRDELPAVPLPTGMPEMGTAPEDMTEAEQNILRTWKQEQRAVHAANNAAKSKRCSISTKLALADEVVDEDAIYFPHSLDFRGRVYPMSAELSPQSDDVSKALLHFADGKKLGETGGYWLAVHIANLFGEDKQSFDDRVQWTLDNTHKLMDSGMSPIDGEKFWTTADEPWCALAACFEWTGFQIEGPDYVSHLPIAMDGSCSGIQHFSAMLRDQRGAEAVNLVSNSEPSDIYTEVLNVVNGRLKASKEPLAKVWQGKVDRKIVKRPCMTFAYSVTSAGIKQQIIDEIRKRQEGDYLPGTSDWEAAHFLAPIVEESIREVVERAAEAMDWLKGVTKHISKQDIPTGWTTPLGFRVLQPYLRSKGRRIKVLYQGEPMFLTLSFEGDKIDGQKQMSAVAPNYVHSLDATHLMMTVNRMNDEDITKSFAVIHDSFGVHACDVDELHYALRDEFIRLYGENEVLVQFYQESLLRMPGEIWPDVAVPPEAGEYDIEEVRDADFFFA